MVLGTHREKRHSLQHLSGDHFCRTGLCSCDPGRKSAHNVTPHLVPPIRAVHATQVWLALKCRARTTERATVRVVLEDPAADRPLRRLDVLSQLSGGASCPNCIHGLLTIGSVERSSSFLAECRTKNARFSSDFISERQSYWARWPKRHTLFSEADRQVAPKLASVPSRTQLFLPIDYDVAHTRHD